MKKVLSNNKVADWRTATLLKKDSGSSVFLEVLSIFYTILQMPALTLIDVTLVYYC